MLSDRLRALKKKNESWLRDRELKYDSAYRFGAHKDLVQDKKLWGLCKAESMRINKG